VRAHPKPAPGQVLDRLDFAGTNNCTLPICLPPRGLLFSTPILDDLLLAGSALQINVLHISWTLLFRRCYIKSSPLFGVPAFARITAIAGVIVVVVPAVKFSVSDMHSYCVPAVAGAPIFGGATAVAGSPPVTGAPAVPGAPTIAGAPAVAGVPAVAGAPAIADIPAVLYSCLAWLASLLLLGFLLLLASWTLLSLLFCSCQCFCCGDVPNLTGAWAFCVFFSDAVIIIVDIANNMKKLDFGLYSMHRYYITYSTVKGQRDEMHF
jgi:hypothetical protein